MKLWFIWIGIGILATLLFIVMVNFLVIKYNGESVPAPVIPTEPKVLGSGKEVTYVVLGDSTSVGQGADYTESFAWLSAEHLAEKYQVNYVNVGVSGARSKDIAVDQVSRALQYSPDIVLISIGANDVTHLTSLNSVKKYISESLNKLRAKNPKIQIIVTGSPDVGTVDRFAWPVRQLAGVRSRQVNKVFEELISEFNLIHAPIYDRVGKAFADDPRLYAADKFHPNARGYALWVPVINEALDKVELGK